MATSNGASAATAQSSASTPGAASQSSRSQPAWRTQTSRPKIPNYTEPSVGNTLELGEFANVPCLSTSEARLILSVLIAKRKEESPDFNDVQSVQQMQDYLDMFARFRNAKLVESVDQLLMELPENVNGFEKSQLKTLACEDADEAKTLIPSLQDKVDDAQLQRLIQEMKHMRQAVGDD